MMDTFNQNEHVNLDYHFTPSLKKRFSKSYSKPFPSGRGFIIWQQKQMLIGLHRCAIARLHVRN